MSTSLIRQGIGLPENVALDKFYAIFWIYILDINRVEQDSLEEFTRDRAGSDRLGFNRQHDDQFWKAWECLRRIEKLRLSWKLGLGAKNMMEGARELPSYFKTGSLVLVLDGE